MNVAASFKSTENARAVSCESGEKGFEVDGKGRAEELLGIGTASANGAVLGELLDSEFGKTSVMSIKCSAD